MDNLESIMQPCKEILSTCKELDEELEQIKNGENFLIEEYKRNKKYFRIGAGRTTIEDVIRTCFEAGWASRKTFDNIKRNTHKN